MRTEQDFVQDFELTPEPPKPSSPPIREPEPAPEPEDIVAPEPEPEPAPAPTPAPAARRTKSKKARPMVPSWEDVLLGTRSNRG